MLELGEAEYMVRARGYLKSLDDFRNIPLSLGDGGTPVLLKDVARIQVGPEMRRGIAELDGQGETVGGVIVMRSGKNALETIEAVKAKLESLKQGLPAGVEIVPTYDRSSLIERAIRHLRDKLIEEFIVVALVCGVFLFHLRSSLVAIITLPLGVLIAFIVMRYQGVNANIMSLGGIAIAIGAMVDAAVVMIENAHKHIERWRHEHPDAPLKGDEQWRVIGDAAAEVGPGAVLQPADHHAVVHSGVRARSAGRPAVLAAGLHQDLCDGRGGGPVGDARAGADGLLDPRAYTGRAQESAQPLADRPLSPAARNRAAVSEVDPARRAGDAGRRASIRRPSSAASSCRRWTRATCCTCLPRLPGLSAGKAAAVLQQTDRMIMPVPEVDTVFGKIGRAETATDPAPLEMVETTIQFKPRDQWRPGMTTAKADRGAGSDREDPRADQRLGAADPQPHRHARHRHQEPARDQGCRAEPGGDRTRRSGASSAW